MPGLDREMWPETLKEKWIFVNCPKERGEMTEMTER